MPFFRELGWDVDNTAGYAEAYRDVILEDQVKVGGAVKAPDYGFRIGSQRRIGDRRIGDRPIAVKGRTYLL